MQFLAIATSIMTISVMAMTSVPEVIHVSDLDTFEPPTLDGPDVIHENGIIMKPLGPNAAVNVSTTGLSARDLECSAYFNCHNMHIVIPGGKQLWSNIHIPIGGGKESGGKEGSHFNITNSRIYAIRGGTVFGLNRVGPGCYLEFQVHGCEIDVYDTGLLGSYNCLGWFC
jgi:hypothetical protein